MFLWPGRRMRTRSILVGFVVFAHFFFFAILRRGGFIQSVERPCEEYFFTALLAFFAFFAFLAMLSPSRKFRNRVEYCRLSFKP
jgi:bacteriorhodopsin